MVSLCRCLVLFASLFVLCGAQHCLPNQCHNITSSCSANLDCVTGICNAEKQCALSHEGVACTYDHQCYDRFLPTYCINDVCTHKSLPGARCVHDAECITYQCVEQTCLGYAESMPCSRHEVCGADLYCSLNRICERAKGERESCSGSTQCKHGLYCDEDHDCVPLYSKAEDEMCKTPLECSEGMLCLDERCTKITERGVPCTHSTDCPSIYHVCNCKNQCQLGNGEYLNCIPMWRTFVACSEQHRCPMPILDISNASCVASHCAMQTYALTQCILRHTVNQQCISLYDRAIYHALQLDASTTEQPRRKHNGGMSEGASVGISLSILTVIVCCVCFLVFVGFLFWTYTNGHILYLVRKHWRRVQTDDVTMDDSYFKTDVREAEYERAHSQLDLDPHLM